MLDALNRVMVVEMKEHFNLGDVYFVLGAEEEYLNIAKRATEFNAVTKELKVPDKPIGFVRMSEFAYDEQRNGFKAKKAGYVYVSKVGKYVGVDVFTVRVGYDVIVYGVFGAQMMDMLQWFLHFDRSSNVRVVLNDQYAFVLPVGLLVEEVSAPVVDMTLRDRGLKLYKIEGRLRAWSYELPVNIRGQGSGEYAKLIWGGEEVSKIQYKPLREIKMKFRIGGAIYGEDGVLLEDEIFPCLLRV